MTEQMELLKKPFPVEALHWRLGQVNKSKTKAMMLVYIDARDVMDRFDEVFGLDWQDDYKEVGGRIVCTITANGISKSDGAGDTDFEAEKGGLSDAFKRAAVKWGVGRYLYEASKYNTWVDYTEETKFKLYEANKEKLDTVARKLSGLEPTRAEKAKATREQNKANCEELKKQAQACINYLNGLGREPDTKERMRAEALLKQLDGDELISYANQIAAILMKQDKIGV